MGLSQIMTVGEGVFGHPDHIGDGEMGVQTKVGPHLHAHLIHHGLPLRWDVREEVRFGEHQWMFISRTLIGVLTVTIASRVRPIARA